MKIVSGSGKHAVGEKVSPMTVYVTDHGHVKICPSCSARWDQNLHLVGKPREVTIEPCPKCDDDVCVSF